MTYVSYVPAPPLARFVAEMYRFDGRLPLRDPTLLLWPAVHFVVNLGPTILIRRRGRTDVILPGGRVSFVGPDGTPFVLESPEGVSLYGVRFRLGGVYPLLRSSVLGLYRQVVPADAYLGRSVHDLCDLLAAAELTGDSGTGFAILEQYLQRQIGPMPAGLEVVHRATTELALNGGLRPISVVARNVGMSHNHLTRQFQRFIGVSPKQLARFYRIARVFATLSPDNGCIEGNGRASDNGTNWATVAQTAGFYDQSHFNREFATFTGYAPSRFVSKTCSTRIVPPDSAASAVTLASPSH